MSEEKKSVMLYDGKKIYEREAPEETFKFRALEVTWPKEIFRKMLKMFLQFAKVLLNGEFSRDKGMQKTISVSFIEEIDGKKVLKSVMKRSDNYYHPTFHLEARDDGYFYLPLGKNGEARSLKTVTELLEDAASMEREALKELEEKVRADLEQRRLLEWKSKLGKCCKVYGPVKCENCAYQRNCNIITIANAQFSEDFKRKSAIPRIQKALEKLNLPDKVKDALSQCKSWNEFKRALRAIRTGTFAVVNFNVKTAKCYVESDHMVINPDKNFYPEGGEKFRKYTRESLSEEPFILLVRTRENNARKRPRVTKIYFTSSQIDSSD